MKVLLKVGKRGEIYTTKLVRERVGLVLGGEVEALVGKGVLRIRPVVTVEKVLRKPKLVRITVEELERLSEEMQREFIG